MATEGRIPRSNIIGIGRYNGRPALERAMIEYRFPNDLTMRTIASDGRIADYYGNPIPDSNSPDALIAEKASIAHHINTLPRADIIFMTGVNDQRLRAEEVKTPPWMRLNFKDVTPMDNNCRLTVNITSYFEATRILSTLTMLAGQQDIQRDEFEVNVLINRKFNEPDDETLKIVRKFKKANPTLRINILDIDIDEDHNFVGRKRNILANTALERALIRSQYTKALLEFPLDADDNNGVYDPYLLRKIVDAFDNDPTIDSVNGHHERMSPAVLNNDLAVLYYRARQFVDAMLMDPQLADPNRPGYNWKNNVRRKTVGPWATRYSTHCEIGGFEETVTTGEDQMFGEKVRILRGYIDPNDHESPPTTLPFLRGTKLIPINVSSNFIRFAQALASGGSAYDGWQFRQRKPPSEREVLRLIHTFRRLNERNAMTFNVHLNDQLKHLFKGVGNRTLFAEFYRPRLLSYLGFNNGDQDAGIQPDYLKQKEGLVLITDWSGFQKKLAELRSRPDFVQNAFAFANRNRDPRLTEIANHLYDVEWESDGRGNVVTRNVTPGSISPSQDNTL